MSEGRHLLVVDDDDRIRDLLKQFLGRSGYLVSTAADAAAAGRLLGLMDFDLVVLDVMMPGEDGFGFLKRLRGFARPAASTPVILLTARGEGDDRITGLSLGADDYLAKPFDPRELLLRIEAILRRAGPRTATSASFRVGDCDIDLDRATCTRNGEAQRLTEAEVGLLRQLRQADGEAVDRFDLISESADLTGRAVDVQVTRLRRKIEPDPRNPTHIQTVRGIGYRLLVSG